MVVISPPLAIQPSVLKAYSANDPLLSNSRILVLYGPASSTNASSSAYIQSHVFTPAGFRSYLRLAVSPNSPSYAAVTCLPRGEQGDEVCRALAFSLHKYFQELPDAARDALLQQCLCTNRSLATVKPLSEAHAANLASRMTLADDSAKIVQELLSAMPSQSLSHLDVDVVLPAGSIQDPTNDRESYAPDETADDVLAARYGQYASLIKLFGESVFLPTSNVRRARSKVTSLSRRSAFSKSQKEALRRELCEMVDTEERYVGKIYDLVHSVAADFREKARAKSASSTSPSERALAGLFPPSLDEILTVNTGFLESAQAVLEETENAAIEDIEKTGQDDQTNATTDPSTLDPTGVIQLSKCLLEWLPKFKDCYGQYVRAHAEFGQHLKMFLKDTSSSFSRRVQATGEQRLMSMLIEPVQRLPRYTLFLDNIIKQLPRQHQALRSLLKAKDIVADICSQDDSAFHTLNPLDRLKDLIPSWPSDCKPRGRILAATEISELQIPYALTQTQGSSPTAILLLFAGSLVIVRKPDDSALSARGLLAEVESPSSTIQQPNPPSPLVFGEHIALQDIHVHEVADDRALRLCPSNLALSKPSKPAAKIQSSLRIDQVRYFLLAGAFESKASRWVKEVAKARVEGRFADAERESYKWEARTVHLANTDLELLAAIIENVPDQERAGRIGRAQVQINVDEYQSTDRLKPGEQGSEIVVSVSVLDNGFFRLEVEGANERSTRDMVTAAEFLPVFAKRLANLLQAQETMRGPLVAAYMLQHHSKMLQALSLLKEAQGRETIKSRTLKPSSPVKMLANLFSPTKDSTSPKKGGRTLAEITPSFPPVAPPSFKTDALPSSPTRTFTIESATSRGSGNNLQRLEDSLNAYILALCARKGNVVGRVVQSRSAADEAEVNELYNTMLEASQNHEAAAQASVDVLFAAFEKFLHVAWREAMGPVVSEDDLQALQAEYGGDISTILDDFAPQNRRALKAIIELMAELLDGASNDGERGILTVAFAEMLVAPPNETNRSPGKGRSHDFVPLLDRFVEDFGAFFGDDAQSERTTPSKTSVNAHARSNKGSISSKASSLTRRLGFSSFRDQRKGDTTSQAGALLRSMSKANRAGESPHSGQSSIFMEGEEMADSKRPVSRDRPSFMNAFDNPSRPGTSGSANRSNHATPLQHTPSSARKKRRSSLSDLTSLPQINNSPMWATPSFQTIGLSPPRPLPVPQQGSPLTPSPTKNAGLSLGYSSSVRVASPQQKENASPTRSATVDRPPALRSPFTVAKTTGLTHPTRAPPPKGVLSERPGSGNTPPPPVGGRYNSDVQTGSPTKKLRMQSPQKLRERLQSQQRAIQEADVSLQAELDSIGEELMTSKGRDAAIDHRSNKNDVANGTRDPHTMAKVVTRLQAQEGLLQEALDSLRASNAALEKDALEALRVAQHNVKRLEDKLALADAESDAAYERMNEELSRVFATCQPGGGGATEELRRKLAESQADAAKWKRENSRLRRENEVLHARLV